MFSFINQFNLYQKKKKKEWNEAALSLLGIATLASVDCELYLELCKKISIESFPGIQVYHKGAVENYNGKSDKTSLRTDADKRIPSSVMEITKETMETFLSKHKTIPKAFFFGKSSKSLLVRSLATQLSDRMMVTTIITSEKKLANKYSVDEFPTLMIIPSENSNDENKVLKPIFYSGRFIGPSILPWLDARALSDDSDDEVLTLIERLTDDSCMDAICLQGGLCAILIVSLDPSNTDINILKEFLPMMNQLGHYQGWMLARTADLPQPMDAFYHFAWLEGNSQKDFLQEAFSLEPQNYPQLVILNAKKLTYSTFAGSFSFKKTKEFLMDVRSKVIKSKSMGLSTLPHLSGETSRCAGMKLSSPKKHESFMDKKTKIGRGQRGGKGPVNLGEDNFNSKLVASEGNWMVAFINKEDNDFKMEWKKASLASKNIVRFGIVNCFEGKNKDLASAYKVNSFPTIKVFSAGLTKNEENAETYKGGLTSNKLKEYAIDLVESGDDNVADISKINMMKWFQYNLDTPRLLLLSEETIVPTKFKAAALEYEKDELIFGFSDDQKLAKSLRVTTFPSLVMLSPQRKTTKSELAFRLRAEDKEVPIGRHRIPIKTLKNMNRLLKWCDNIVEQWQDFKKKHMSDANDFMEDPAWTAHDAPYMPEMEAKMPRMPHTEL